MGRKSCSTYMTAKKATAARENINKYAWARDEIYNKYIKTADLYTDRLEKLYNLIHSEGVPRSVCVGAEGDPDIYKCRYCGKDLSENFGGGLWKSDPLNEPWKIQCPVCGRKFPSNDFEGFYKLGLDEYGRFDASRAHKKNDELVKKGEEGFLVNKLYPEAEEKFGDKNWGVDDGLGYVTGRVYENGVKERHTYIAQFAHYGLWYTNSMSAYKTQGVIMEAVNSCANAYFFTGELKYGRIAAILLDRIADFYREYDISIYGMDVWNSHGGSNLGKLVGCIWETFNARDMAIAYDMVYDVYEDSFVLDYLKNKSESIRMVNPKNSAADIRYNIEERLLVTIFEGIKDASIMGNFGFPQMANAVAAVVLDDEVRTKEWLDYLLAPGWKRERPCLGGGIAETLIELVDADGQGNEASGYNNSWHRMLIDIAEVLEDYSGYDAANLYKNPKFLQMFYSTLPLISLDYSPQIGDNSACQEYVHWMSVKVCENGFRVLRDPVFAQALYLLNGNTSKGLHYGITTENPERLCQEVQAVIDKYGELDLESAQMSGFGYAILRRGKGRMSAENENRSDVWMYFGSNTGHGHRDSLNLGMTAYGLNFLPELGYPEKTGFQPNRLQWIRTTLSHNTVMVSGKEQSVSYEKRGTTLHFDDCGKVKLFDVDAKSVYPETHEYRRTVLSIGINERDSYIVDLFRVDGGDSHLYSLHAASDNIKAVKGAKLIPQTDENGKYIGSYAGADVPFGKDPNSPAEWEYETVYPRGYTWTENVDSAASVPDKVEIDFEICDFRNHLKNKRKLGLSAVFLNSGNRGGKISLATVDAYPPRNASNRDIGKLKYVFLKNEGKDIKTVFTTVFEPYCDEKRIASVCELPMLPEGDNNCRAIKVMHKSGRCDYIMYSADNTTQYIISDEKMSISFRGFAGVYTVENGKNTYRYICDGDVLDGKIGELSAICGTVRNFTHTHSEENEIVFEADCELPEKVLKNLIGRIAVVDNGNEARNGAYTIKGVSRVGRMITLNIGRTTLIRSFKETMKPEKGYVYNISVGQRIRIPLSYEA